MEETGRMHFCALCGVHACKDSGNNFPEGCATLDFEWEDTIKKYTEDEYKIARTAAVTSADYTLTRMEEIMAFAKGCEFQKLGLAFCSALSREAKVVYQILKNNGFSVESVICKAGNFHKDMLGMEKEKLLCNPIGQAQMMNEAGTDLNIILGLCVGHDTLFMKYSDAPVTVLAVKDRVLGHNPLAAIYMADTFYKNRFLGKGHEAKDGRESDK